MDSSIQRESFIVRVWWKPELDVLEVRIQHIRSGESAVVRDLEGMAAFIERWAPRPAERERRGLS